MHTLFQLHKIKCKLNRKQHQTQNGKQWITSNNVKRIESWRKSNRCSRYKITTHPTTIQHKESETATKSNIVSYASLLDIKLTY